MAGSRTIKSLTALVIAMTVGAFALVLLETAPILPPVPALSAESPAAIDRMVKQTDVPIEEGRWRNVVVHTAREGQDVAGKCHFLVDGAAVVATENWKRQYAANHVVAYARGHDYNADSVGVFVRGDLPQSRPSAEESNSLLELVAALQQTCRIDRGRVYFHSDLNPYVPTPSHELAAKLTGRLLRIEP